MQRQGRGKSCGDDGLYAEMLKTKHTGLIDLIARVFTDILHGASDVPAVWWISRLIVLYKKGDASLPKNYRPIAKAIRRRGNIGGEKKWWLRQVSAEIWRRAAKMILACLPRRIFTRLSEQNDEEE